VKDRPRPLTVARRCQFLNPQTSRAKPDCPLAGNVAKSRDHSTSSGQAPLSDVQQQVPRLCSVIRHADDGTSLGMTDFWGWHNFLGLPISVLRQLVTARAVRRLLFQAIGFLFLLAAAPAFAADHPDIPKGSECLSCHVEKTKGQSVHFDFTQACTVCHVVKVDDGKTSISMVLPKEKICYSCHEKAAMDKSPIMKGECVSCHDPHNSERLYLLRRGAPTGPHEKASG